jgi:hypothetical protein
MRAPLALLLSAIPLVVSATVPVQAEPKRSPKNGILGFVTAESRYGAGTITAPVRISALGRREVRLPGGTWIECRRSCANTLRQETIDFWHIRANGNASGDDGPGYFTWSWKY